MLEELIDHAADCCPQCGEKPNSSMTTIMHTNLEITAHCNKCGMNFVKDESPHEMPLLSKDMSVDHLSNLSKKIKEISLSEQAALSLTEDQEYRVREIVREEWKIMMKELLK